MSMSSRRNAQKMGIICVPIRHCGRCARDEEVGRIRVSEFKLKMEDEDAELIRSKHEVQTLDVEMPILLSIVSPNDHHQMIRGIRPFVQESTYTVPVSVGEVAMFSFS